ncbi:MAG: abortive phage infection protein [Clostridia bacterium]|nr:abortive phage infection protein [Clostridia bacterium]
MDVRTEKAFTTLKQLARANGGYLRTADAAAHGVNRPMLARFVVENEFERVARGIYMGPEAWPDDYYVLQLRYPKLIFSHLSALRLHGLTDYLPRQAQVTLWTGCNPSLLSANGVKVYTVKHELHELGLTTMQTYFGNTIRVYDMERTVCDVLRSRNKIETQAFYQSMKSYSQLPGKDWPKLVGYARSFELERILTHYMEVLMA